MVAVQSTLTVQFYPVHFYSCPCHFYKIGQNNAPYKQNGFSSHKVWPEHSFHLKEKVFLQKAVGQQFLVQIDGL